MSVDTARAPRVSSVRATAQWLLMMHLYLAAWAWGIAIVVVTLAIVAINTVGEVENSVLSFARQGAIWFPFAVFIAITAAYLPVHIAAGLTRRSLAAGSILAAVGTGIAYGLVYNGLLLVERAVFGAMGWQWRVLEGMSPDTADPLAIATSTTLTFVVAYLSGLLVGITYQRAGGWWGTLALPLTVGPILVVSVLFAYESGPLETSEWIGSGQSSLVAAVASLLIAAVMAFAFDRLTRGADVPRRTS
ncbi:hypothetical protein [Cellulomonas sp.]|uniref:hypothetical protein n=1 Tax=Cellulomonas sp. TaxID=40001 RepID=UPI003BAC1FC4